MNEDFETDIQIGSNISKECTRQAYLYHYYSKKLVNARAEKDRLKVLREYTEAEVEMELREDPPEGLKVTESVIMSLVKLNEEVMALKQKETAAWREVNEWEHAVKALEHKKAMLDNVVQLQIKGLYATPDGGKHVREQLNKNKGDN